MDINIGLPSFMASEAEISVLGLGGAGCNVVENFILEERARFGDSGGVGVNCFVANTDAQVLANSLCENRIQLGALRTRGLGAGASPEVGRLAAKDSIREILSTLGNSDMVFIAAGMGGGTGTGAAPLIAKYLKKIKDGEDDDCEEDDDVMSLVTKDILVVAVVTKPFAFEGSKRMLVAEYGIEKIQKYADTVIILPNQYLFRVINERTTLQEAFKKSDEFLTSSVREISDLITGPGLINLDFADIKTIMGEGGRAMIGIGSASGENRAIVAAEAAISNPLLDDSSMKGAKGVLINISGGDDMTLFEVDAAAHRVKEEVDNEANIIFGSTFNKDISGNVTVSVVATGIENSSDNSRKNIKVQNQEKVALKNKVMVTADCDIVDPSDYGDTFISKRNIVDPENDDFCDDGGDIGVGDKGFFSSFNSISEGDLYNKKNSGAISDIPAFLRRNKK